MSAALDQTFVVFTGSITALACRGRAEILADAWRHAAASVEDSLRFIRQHRLTLEEAGSMLADGSPRHGPDYLASIAEMLPWRIERYRRALRAVSEAEAEMTALGIPFALSSNHWRCDVDLCRMSG